MVQLAKNFLKQISLDCVHIEELQGSLNHRNYLVRQQINSHQYQNLVLKQYHIFEYQTFPLSYGELNRVCDTLQAAGICTVKAKSILGKTVHHFDGYDWQLFDYVSSSSEEDEALIQSTLNQASVMGQMLFKIHQASIEVNLPKYEFNIKIAPLLRRIGQTLYQSSDYLLKEQLTRVLKKAHLEIHDSPKTDKIIGPFVLSHGDMHKANVLWSPGPYLIDWERTGYYHQGFDILALALNWSILKDNRGIWYFDNTLYNKVLLGYHEAQKIEGKSPFGIQNLAAQFEESYIFVIKSWVSWLIELLVYYDNGRINKERLLIEFDIACSHLELIFNHRAHLRTGVERLCQ